MEVLFHSPVRLRHHQAARVLRRRLLHHPQRRRRVLQRHPGLGLRHRPRLPRQPRATRTSPRPDAITTRLLTQFAAGPAGTAHPAVDNLARLGIRAGGRTASGPGRRLTIRAVSYRPTGTTVTQGQDRVLRVVGVGGNSMPDTMRAFVIKKVGETGVVEKPIPEPGPEEAIVKTTAALICTSDVHTVKGALPVPDGRTLGHESVGRHPQARLGGHRLRGGPARRRLRGDALLPVQLLPARLHQPVRRPARRLQVHRPDGRQHGRVLRRPGGAGQPHADPRRPHRRPGRLHLRHAHHRFHGRRARLPAVRRDRRGLRAGPGRPVRHHGREPDGRRAGSSRSSPGRSARRWPSSSARTTSWTSPRATRSSRSWT